MWKILLLNSLKAVIPVISNGLLKIVGSVLPKKNQEKPNDGNKDK